MQFNIKFKNSFLGLLNAESIHDSLIPRNSMLSTQMLHSDTQSYVEQAMFSLHVNAETMFSS